MTIDCETHDIAVIEAGRLERRVAELEAALDLAAPLIGACFEEFCSEKTEVGDAREFDYANVFVGQPDGVGITFGKVRAARTALLNR